MSGTARLLERLSDGAWHSHDSLYHDLGVMVHSRCADLRRRGHVIHVRREWSKSQRRNFWFYRLAASPGEPLVSAATGGERRESTGAAGGSPEDTTFGVRTTAAFPEPPRGASPACSPLMQRTTSDASAVAPETRPEQLFDAPARPLWA